MNDPLPLWAVMAVLFVLLLAVIALNVWHYNHRRKMTAAQRRAEDDDEDNNLTRMAW